MKRFLLLFSFLITGLILSAQVPTGSKLSKNIKGVDINGNEVDIFADLDAGYSVAIDVFATWCGPCWDFHGSGVMALINEVLGPEGTNQVRCYGIEADGTTAYESLFVANDESWGDWTAGVEYSILNDHSFNSTLNIAYFPTLYVIRPDRTIIEIADYRFDLEYWQKALVPAGEKDLLFTSGISGRSFCKDATFVQRPQVINMGTSTISNIKLDLAFNDDVQEISIDGDLELFNSKSLNLGTKKVEETTIITVTVKEMDGIAPAEPIVLTGGLYKPTINNNTFQVRYTTDFYPSETSWEIKDDKNNVIFSQPNYRAGNADSFGGGGPDANKEFVYDIEIEDTQDISCLTMTVFDEYGDGTPYFAENQGHPVPGVEVYNSDGELLKPKFDTDWDFKASAKTYITYASPSSLEDQAFVESLSVYPSPAVDILNIDIKIKDNMDYQIYVSDIMGNKVSHTSNNVNYISVSDLAAGMYFLNVQTKEGVFAHKFTKI